MGSIIISDEFKKNIDSAIDNSINNSKDSYDKSFNNEKKLNSYRHKNSTKLNHFMHQVSRVHHSMNLSDPKDRDIVDQSAFVCDSSDTVEQLMKCVLTDEMKKAKEDISNKVKNSERLFKDIVDGKGIDTFKNDMATLEKGCANDLIDEFSTLGKGLVQLPLAFLNGSSSITLAESTLDDIFKDIFEVFGLILFQDKDKFKTVEDVGYFLISFDLYMTLSFFHDDETFTSNKSIDIVKYIKSGDFRKSINGMNSTEGLSKEHNMDLVGISEIIDASISIAIHAFNYLGEKLANPVTFILLRQFVVPVALIVRMGCRVVILKKHASKDEKNIGEYIYAVTAVFSDLLHFVALISKMFQQIIFKYKYISTGANSNPFYILVTFVHVLVVLIESLLNDLLVLMTPINYFGASNKEKNTIQISKKMLELIVGLFIVFEDIFSGESEEEKDASPALLSIEFIVLAGALILEISVLLLTLDYELSHEES